MSMKFSGFAVTRARNMRQAYVLLALGVICLLVAWLVHPSTNDYPLGVLVLGAGLLIGGLLNPYKLLIGGCLGTLVGLAVFLFFSHRIPGNQAFPAYIVAIGVALMIIGILGRRGYVKAGAISPGLIVLGIGIVEVLLAANRTPSGFLPFVLSFWFPGIVLIVAGLFYLATSGRIDGRR
jgi:hypothetical protein